MSTLRFLRPTAYSAHRLLSKSSVFSSHAFCITRHETSSAFRDTHEPSSILEDSGKPCSPVSTIPASPLPEQILRSALENHVLTSGWSRTSISRTAQDLGYPSVTHGLFPRDGVDLVHYFLADARRNMRVKVEAQLENEELRLEWQKSTSREKLRRVIEARLNLLVPYVTKWPEAIALLSHPANLPTALHELQLLVDDMLHLAEDRAVDMSWYSKRAALAAIFTSTEVFMTQDTSASHSETFRFLDRRLDESESLGKVVTEIGILGEFAARSTYGILASSNLVR